MFTILILICATVFLTGVVVALNDLYRRFFGKRYFIVFYSGGTNGFAIIKTSKGGYVPGAEITNELKKVGSFITNIQEVSKRDYNVYSKELNGSKSPLSEDSDEEIVENDEPNNGELSSDEELINYQMSKNEKPN